MEITEVRIKLVHDVQERLLAFCSITIDAAFVIRDLKLINGSKGPFVAMPSRKLCDRCPHCGHKNHLRAAYCCECGKTLDQQRAEQDEFGRARLYADIAHPINSRCRDLIQLAVLQAYDRELELSRQSGYVSRYDDLGEWHEDEDDDFRTWEPAATQQRLDPPDSVPGPHQRSAAANVNSHRPSAENDEFGAGIFS
ncbi:MAG: SpoVG family protein [Planctomycetaceae bacterium]|nr:SpoVG family protein [Planctomycetaceae bacterium]